MRPPSPAWRRGAQRHRPAATSAGLRARAVAIVWAIVLPAAVRAAPAGPLEALCVGAEHSCARRGAAVACWGDNDRHQVAASAAPQLDAPRLVTELPPATELRCGAFETCDLSTRGAVTCLGGPPRAETLTPGQPARDLILHARGGCVLLRDGAVSCWSRPAAEEINGGGPIRVLRPVPAPRDGTGFVAAPSTATAVCLARRDAPPFCFRTDDGEAGVTADAALAGAVGLVMARSSGSPLCAWFAGGHVRCAASNVPAAGGAALAVPAALKVPRLLAPFDGGICAPTPEKPACFGDVPALVTAAPAATTALAVGDDHACVIARGAIACWGAASHGQLGAGAVYLHARPRPVPGLTDAVQLDASTLQACALRRSGEALCWGQMVDESGRLEARFVPWTLSPPPGSRAIRAAGEARMPGHGAAEPPCANVATHSGKPSASWRCLSSRGWARAAALPAGPLARANPRLVARDGRCGLDAKARLVCADVAAVGTTPGRPSRPIVVASKRRFRDVASGLFDGGRAVVCGLTEDRRVECFHVADGAAAAPIAAPGLAALRDVTQLAAAGRGEDSVACALTGAGAVSCWGDGRFDQLGGAMPPGRFDPVAIAGLPPLVELAVGGTFVCGRTAGGEVFCWGSNRDGAAPDGAPGSSPTPSIVDVPWPRG